MGLPIDFFRSVLGPTAGSKDVSLAEARYLGYQNGTLNYSEMEIDIGFLPQFLSFRSVEAIFMPQYVFDLLQQHGITKIINGTKIAPTLAGEIAIITYTDNFIEAVSQTRP